MVCNGRLIENTIEVNETAGNSSLSYDPLSDQYSYLWKTDKLWKGQCRQLQIAFADGSVRTAFIRYK